LKGICQEFCTGFTAGHAGAVAGTIDAVFARIADAIVIAARRGTDAAVLFTGAAGFIRIADPVAADTGFGRRGAVGRTGDRSLAAGAFTIAADRLGGLATNRQQEQKAANGEKD
jgi:hypothetical protein